jgi:predicted transcriptional regulator of viral defense system
LWDNYNFNKIRQNNKKPEYIKIIIDQMKVKSVLNTVAISENQMIFSIDELKEKGLSYYKINQMVDQGVLVKLNKKFYENKMFRGEESEFYYAYAYVPDGVVCLLSAAVYYNLSSYRPDAIDVAIPRKARVSTLPDWPEIHVCYFTDDRFEAGIETIADGNNQFRIYDIEKTVVDVVYYREKVGIPETKEVLTTYLRRKDRNLNRLIRYAEMLKCGDVMKKYLEVLV